MISWEVVSLLLVGWGLLSAWHVARTLRRNRHETASVDGVDVVVTEACGPAAVGVLRSRVVMPRWVLALPRAQRQYILRHEDEHRKARDAALLMLTSLAVVLTPWNLPVWWQLRRLGLAVEMDCDQRVVRSLGNADAYGALLLQVAEANSRSPRMQPALIGRVSLLESRLIGLLAPVCASQTVRLVLALGALLLLGVVLTAPHPMPGAH
jgi:beta-lactamase regulating signal transducer with metallopeptidase domain